MLDPSCEQRDPSAAHAAAAFDQAIALLRALSRIETALPLRLLRSEAKLLALIKEEPDRPVKYYLNKSDLSYRGFFNALGILVKANLVSERANGVDRRQKLLS